jgi:TonB family protein
MEILKYVKYCLSLFEECTINGLGTFRFAEAPAEKDTNDNLIKKKYNVITFKSHPVEKPRLVNIIAGKEGCTIEHATAQVGRYVQSIQQQLNENKEVWISEIGLMKKENNELILLSHKFLVKSFKNNYTSSPKQAPAVFSDAQLVSPSPAPELVEFSSPQPSAFMAVEQKKASYLPEKQIETTSNSPRPASRQKDIDIKAAAPLAAPAAVNASYPNQVGFAGNKSKVVSQPDGLSIETPGFKLGSQELYNKLAILSKKYIVHIGIAIGLLIATIVTIKFYLSEKNTSLNAGTSILTSLDNKEGEPPVNTESIQFGEAINDKGATNKENKNNSSANKDISNDKKSKSEKGNLNTLSAAVSDTQATSVSNENLGDATSNDHMPAPGIERENTEQNKPAPSAPVNIAAPAPVTEKKEAPPVVSAEITDPQFPGGEKAIDKFIRNKVQYPERALEDGISGTVKVSFSVDETGNVNNPIIIEGLGGGCNEEALRVISKMPKWTPATRDGVKVSTRKTIKITFKQAKQP